MQQIANRMFSPRWADCRAALIGWGACMGLLAGYCALYTAYVQAAPVDLADAALWPVREWGTWLVLGPLVCAALRALHASAPGRPALARGYVVLCTTALGIALGCRVGLDVLDGARFPSSVVYFLPRHATALALVVLAWHLWRRPAAVGASAMPEPDVVAGRLPPSGTLLVSQGRQERLIRVGDIDVVSAAGNYVDIRCGDAVYLLRSPLRQLEETLAPGQFVRVHRSHLVNVGSILRISRTAAGNGEVVVRGGHSVPMSKKYRSLLKASCALPAARA